VTTQLQLIIIIIIIIIIITATAPLHETVVAMCPSVTSLSLISAARAELIIGCNP
jgi:hypothetical protein